MHIKLLTIILGFNRFIKILVLVLLVILVLGFFLPERKFLPLPFETTTNITYDSLSFWYYPWGNNTVHKGVDFFGEKGQIITSPTYGVVLRKGYGTIAGNYIYILGPRWKIYYFAHLDTILNSNIFVKRGEKIGQMGNTGNASGKPHHLHYSIYTFIPYVWLFTKNKPEGWKRMFYLNPLTQSNL